MTPLPYTAELTDTRDGKPAYSWALRKPLESAPHTTTRALIRRAKSALSISHIRHTATHTSDTITLHLIGVNMVAFIYMEGEA